MQTVPFFRPYLDDSEINAVVETLRSGWLTTGQRAVEFEKEFSSYVHQAYAVAVNSCTAALHLALEALGVRSGDTVLVPTMTFAATAEVVRYLDAKPLLVDCNPDDFNLSVQDATEKLAAALGRGERVTAIVPVHVAGQIADMERVLLLARAHGLKVVEDAAHCCPAYYRRGENEPWRPVGAESDAVCFSFYANKCITTGEGGMACTGNAQWAERMRIMSLHGISKDAWKRFAADGSWHYEIIAPGFKYNLTDIAAALGIIQLRRADRFLELRRSRAELYQRLLGDVEEIVLPKELSNRQHAWHLYMIRLRLNKLRINRAEFVSALKTRGIGASVHWLPLHMHPYYRETYGYKPQDLPFAAGLYPQIVSLPLYPSMTDGEVEYVCGSIKDIIAAAVSAGSAGSSQAPSARTDPPMLQCTNPLTHRRTDAL
jgi:perosamine synthetase